MSPVSLPWQLASRFPIQARPQLNRQPRQLKKGHPLPLKKRMVFIPGTRERLALPSPPVVEQKLEQRAAKAGVTFKNTGTEPFVSLRYYGPDVHSDLPAMGAYKKG